MSSTQVKLTVLLRPEEAARLSEYCQATGHKKSTLVAKLIRDHLDAANTAIAPRRARSGRAVATE